ncbi:hypothetical protein B0H13DRAFT_1873164 [Mycena leptocephala]|nr:hypothetical protein B0H13DRAFT_1873164 [Mycena leptocephala]
MSRQTLFRRQPLGLVVNSKPMAPENCGLHLLSLFVVPSIREVGLGPGFLLTGLGSLSSPLSSASEVFLALGLGPGFFLAGGAAWISTSDVSELKADFRFVDRVVHTGTTTDGGKSSPSEGGSMGVGEVGNSRGASDFEPVEDKGLNSGRVSVPSEEEGSLSQEFILFGQDLSSVTEFDGWKMLI